MATYNPPPELFARQIESLKAQTHSNWVALVNDDCSNAESYAMIREVIGNDSRFRLERNPSNLGFYHNFERCLNRTAVDAAFIALCDQDDEWQPDKLATLLSAFDAGTGMVYSDMRIVDHQGRLVSPTYWTTRRPNERNLASLLLANTVTGAAAVFRRELLAYILPFPPRLGASYHDHWIACVALALAKIKYIDRPLYDYVQHGTNAIGQVAPRPMPAWKRLARWVRSCWPFHLVENGRSLLNRGCRFHSEFNLRLLQMAQALEQRCGDRITAGKRLQLRRILALEHSPMRLLWLALRPMRSLSGINETMNVEYTFVDGFLWAASVRLRHWLRGMW